MKRSTHELPNFPSTTPSRMQVSFLQILTLLSVILYGVSSTAPVICSDICNTTSSAYSCATFTGVFNQVNPGTTVWFNANIANPASVTQTGFAFTNQRITIGSFVWNPPNAFITIDSSSTASTSFTGGRWVTTAGSSCGNVFLSGFQVDPSSQIATSMISFHFCTNLTYIHILATTFEWCGLFQSQTTFTTNPSWQFGAAAYNTSSFTTDYSALGVKPSNNCPTSIGPAGLFSH